MNRFTLALLAVASALVTATAATQRPVGPVREAECRSKGFERMTDQTEPATRIAPPDTGRTQLLPRAVSLRQRYDAFGLSVCKQNGPLCWDYTTVGLLEFELATRRKRPERLSPGYLAWATDAAAQDGTGGSNFGRACRGLERFGITSLELGGDPDAKGHGAEPSQAALDTAARLGRVEFHWIRFWNDHDEISATQMTAIKTEIASGHPVAVGMRWPKRTRFAPGTQMMRVPAKENIFDGHCVALVGYTDDDALPGGGAFLFRNSWGSEWGDGGYAWMPYALLSFCINDAYSLRLLPEAQTVSGTVSTFNADRLPVSEASGPKPEPQDMAKYGQSWGDGRQLFFRPEQPAQGFTLTVPVAADGQYELRLVVTHAEDYGRFQVKIGGEECAVIDGAGAGVSRSRPLSLGVFHLKAGGAPIRFTVVGKGPASSGYNVGIDEIQLVSRS